MPAATLRQLLEAGVHFGHQTSRWNPKMRRYIFTARNGIHIIDLEQSQTALDEARNFAKEVVAGGDTILFVGTKKQAQDSIESSCEKSTQPYVIHRWLGGLLTNFGIIQQRLRLLVDLREMRDRGDFGRMSGKEANANKDELEHLERNLGGMVGMKRLPGAVFIIDCKREHLAVLEANRLSIPIIALVDTNCDPERIQHVIPGNDDAIRSVKLVIDAITESIVEGNQLFAELELREAQAAKEAAEAQAAAAAAAAVAAAAEEAKKAAEAPAAKAEPVGATEVSS
jgi:small subunit ribosomal protein S2